MPEYNLFGSQTAANEDGATIPVTLAVRFFSDLAGNITAVRFYKPSSASGSSHTVALWNGSGTLLVSKASSGETASGWQRVDLDTPIGILAATEYMVGVYWPVGRWPQTTGYFSAQYNNAPLHAYADGSGPAGGIVNYNGAYSDAATLTLPDQTNASKNYFSDIVLSATAPLFVTAASTSRADVQTAIDTVADTGTVFVPAGTSTWTSSVNITGKTITLQGAGTGAGGTKIIHDGTAHTLLTITAGALTGKMDISGFWFSGGAVDYWSGSSINFSGPDGWKNIRIHHNLFDGNREWSIRGSAASYGLIDNNTFQGSAHGMILAGRGDTDWSTSLVLGTSDFFFIENNIFNCNDWFGTTGAIDLDFATGGRIVFRNNTSTFGFLETHDYAREGVPSANAWEIYNNSFASTTNKWKGLDISAGTGVIWGNTFTGDWTHPIGGVDYKSFDPRNSLLCDGTDPLDQNVAGQTGWRCQYQIGSQGQGPTAVGYPAYIWSNTLNGVSTGMAVTDGANHVVLSRDYFNNGTTPKPGYTSYAFPHPLSSSAASITIPQAASIMRLPWLDAPAAFSGADASQISGLYRYNLANVAITHFSKQDDTFRTTTSVTAVEVPQFTINWTDLTAAGFSASDDVLIIVGVKTWNSSINGNTAFSIGFGTTYAGRVTDTTSSQTREPANNSRGDQYNWIDRRTLVASENIYFSLNTLAAGTATAKEFFCLILAVSDLTTTNFAYDEINHTGDAPTAFGTTGATFSIPAGGDWLLFACSQWSLDNIDNTFSMDIQVGGTDRNIYTSRAVDIDDQACVGTLMYSAGLGAGSVVRARFSTPTHAQPHDCIRTAVLGLRLDAFYAHWGSYSTASITHSVAATYQPFAANASFVIDINAALLIIGYPASSLNETTKSPQAIIKIDGAGWPDINANEQPISDNGPTSHVGPWVYGYNQTQSAGTYNIELSCAEANDVTPTYVTDRRVAAVIVLSPAAATPQSRSLTSSGAVSNIITRTYSSDVIAEKALSISTSSDAIASLVRQITISTETLAQATRTATTSASAAASTSILATLSSNSAVLKALTDTASLDVAAQILGRTSTTSANTAASILRTIQNSVDAIATLLFSVTHQSDAAILGNLTRTASADIAAIKMGLTRTLQSDLGVALPRSFSSAANGAVTVPGLLSLSGNTIAMLPRSMFYVADLLVTALRNTQTLLDIVASINGSRTASFDTVTVAGSSIAVATQATGAVIAPKSITASLQTSVDILRTITSSLSTVASVSANRTASFDTVTVAGSSIAIALEATGAVTVSRSIAADLQTCVDILRNVSTVADSVCRATQSSTLTSEAAVMLGISATSSSDVVAMKLAQISQVADCVALALKTISSSVDAIAQATKTIVSSLDVAAISGKTSTTSMDVSTLSISAVTTNLNVVASSVRTVAALMACVAEGHGVATVGVDVISQLARQNTLSVDAANSILRQLSTSSDTIALQSSLINAVCDMSVAQLARANTISADTISVLLRNISTSLDTVSLKTLPVNAICETAVIQQITRQQIFDALVFRYSPFLERLSEYTVSKGAENRMIIVP